LQNDLLTVKVKQLSSVKTQVPYPYHSLPFCRPDTIVNSAGSLGELLRGDRIESSPYVVSNSAGLRQLVPVVQYISNGISVFLLTPPGSCFCRHVTNYLRDVLAVNLMQFEMMEPKLCQVACRIVLSQQGAKDFKEKIDDEYRVTM